MKTMALNVRELQQKSTKTEIQYTTLKNMKVQKDHYDACIAVGIEPDLVVQEAFKDIFLQIDKDSRLKSIVGDKKQIHETMSSSTQRGEFDFEKLNAHEKILKYMRANPEEKFTTQQLAEGACISIAYAYKSIKELLDAGTLNFSTGSDGARMLYIAEHGDPEIAVMVPSGTKISMMR